MASGTNRCRKLAFLFSSVQIEAIKVQLFASLFFKIDKLIGFGRKLADGNSAPTPYEVRHGLHLLHRDEYELQNRRTAGQLSPLQSIAVGLLSLPHICHIHYNQAGRILFEAEQRAFPRSSMTPVMRPSASSSCTLLITSCTQSYWGSAGVTHSIHSLQSL